MIAVFSFGFRSTCHQHSHRLGADIELILFGAGLPFAVQMQVHSLALLYAKKLETICSYLLTLFLGFIGY